MAVTRAQKVRLGVFLLMAGLILAGTMVALLGMAFLEKRDEYVIRFQGSVGGLEPGSTVRYNGMHVGRVERLGIDPKNVAAVEVTISLRGGTPIKADTVAVLNLQGLTGLKFIELSGGTNASELLDPGEEIESAESTLDVLASKATAIATQIEQTLENINEITGGDNAHLLRTILTEVELFVRTARTLIADNEEGVTAIVGNLARLSDGLVFLLDDARMTMSSARDALDKASSWVDREQVAGLIGRVEGVVRALDRRVGDKELGQLLADATQVAAQAYQLLRDADLTLIRAQDDIGRVLDEAVTAAENLAEFAAIVRDNPSTLLGGESREERKLP